MNITPWQEHEFETVQVAEAVDIRRVAEWASTPVQTIQELNPELRRWTTPVRATDYELKVPDGHGGRGPGAPGRGRPGELAALNRHTVKKGETLASIAKRLKVSRADLAEANYLSVRSKVKPGQQLIIPRAPTLLLATHTDNPAPVVESRSADVATASNVVVPQPEETAQAKLIHRVKRGDTLFSIAKLYRTTVSSLKQWNRIQRKRHPGRTAADDLQESANGDELIASKGQKKRPPGALAAFSFVCAGSGLLAAGSGLGPDLRAAGCRASGFGPWLGPVDAFGLQGGSSSCT